MNKTFSALLFFSCFLFLKCSDQEINKSSTSASTLSSVNQSTKSSSNTGGKLIFLGRLNWSDDSQVYYSNFSQNSDLYSFTTLTFIGPHPIPTNLTPTFHLTACNIPTSNVSDQFPNGELNTFQFNFAALTSGSSAGLVVPSLKWVNNQLDLINRTILDPSATPTVITINGKVVYIDGDYYAVATSFQLPNQPSVPISPTDGNTDTNSATTIKISQSKPLNSNYDMKIYYGTSDGDWIAMDEVVFFPKNVQLQFKVEITSRSSVSTKFILRPSVGSQVTTFIDPGTTTVLGPTSLSTYAANGSINLSLIEGH